ncbi:lipopolysaccharide core heptose(II) kinase RfaY [Fusobacterium sp. PH5-44]|uniref:lipopolysaccharide core heptose(II) kinase RfaY n=1 Tax=unclassified Fusobacterium TaxID=2648384 RepID=UPI003D1FCD8F
MIIKEINYKEFKIHYFNTKELELGKKIIDKKYKLVRVFKNTKRNYVALISIDGEYYVLKEPRNEFRLIQRKIMTFFKDGEAVTTLKNIRNHIEKYDIVEYVTPYVAITKRNLGFINYSGLLMEYCNGEAVGEYYDEVSDRYKKNKVVEIMIRIHEFGLYHGDMNAYNFNLVDDAVRILDTQGKKMCLGNYRAHYDMLTFKIENFPQMKYPYKKNLFFYLALEMKKMKKFKIIRWIKAKKKRRRNRKK